MEVGWRKAVAKKAATACELAAFKYKSLTIL